MSNSPFVQVLNSFKTLPENQSGFWFCVVFILLVLDSVEELPASATLHHNLQLILVFKNFLEFNYILVLHGAHDANFIAQLAKVMRPVICRTELVLVYHLGRILVFGLFLNNQSGKPKLPGLAKPFAQSVFGTREKPRSLFCSKEKVNLTKAYNMLRCCLPTSR